MEGNQEIFIAKLDRFIRKYYQNQILRGVLLSVLVILPYWLIVSFTEYFLYFSVPVRTTLAIFSVLLAGFIMIKLVVIPVIGLFKIGDRITYRQAITIITKYFPNLEDRLLNTLELTELLENEEIKENSLLLASINQRIESIRLIPFRRAISFKGNFVYLRYLLILFVIFVAVYLLIPDLYSSSAKRLVHFRQKYTPPADFYFDLDSESLKVVKGSDYLLNVQTKGKYSPENAYIVYGENRFLLKKEKTGSFSYMFRNVNNNIPFYFQAGKVESKEYVLKALSKPGIRSFALSVEPPGYTQLPLKVEKNLGDLSVQEGSKLSWEIIGEDADKLELHFSDTIVNNQTRNISGNFDYSRVILKKLNYQIYLSNQEFKNELFANYNIDVIPDLYPQIQVSSIQDSSLTSAYYFKGLIKDDYGFSNLRFAYEVNGQSPVNVPISMKRNLTSQEFYFAFDFALVGFEEGSQVRYYFEVFDNDEVNNPKMARTEQFNFYIPNSKQLYDLNSAVQDSITNQLEKGIDLSQSIQDDILRLQKNALDGSTDKWQQQQLFQQIESKKDELDMLLKEIQNENFRKNQLMNSMGVQDSLLMEKQKQIDELLEKVMDDELQKLFEEFNKLAEDFKSEELNKLGNQLKMSFEDFQKQMDRNLELLERYEIEVQMKQLVDRIEKLADEHENSAEENRDTYQLKQQQELDQKKWKELEEDLADVLEKNLDIKKPIFISGMKTYFPSFSS